MRHLLSEVEQAQVAEHVTLAERATAGEIVVVVAERSAGYERQRAAFSFVLTLAVAVGVYTFVHDVPAIWVLCGQAPLALFAWWLSGSPGLTRWLVPEEVRREAAAARAKQLFVEQGVTETRQRSGVLLYLSEVEHRVELVADRGIHERVGAELWQSTVAQVVEAIHRGRAAEGIIGAVDAIGACLAANFPPTPDDTNELSNAPRRV
jgi:putative membrane protein